MSDIQPFGTSTDGAQPDLAVIKAFGCTVIDFSVSADWSSQAGSLSFKIIEDEADGDRLVIPVLGSPHLFELKDTDDNVLFQYIGLVDSFSRSSSNSKTYSIQLTSPLTILSGTEVILDGFLGLGGSAEGLSDFSGTGIYDFGHRNNLIGIGNSPGPNKWWNVSNLINVFGLLENDDPTYRVPFQYNLAGFPTEFGDYGFSARSADGIPLVKLMYALHVGINHLPIRGTDIVGNTQNQQTHGGNLLFGRHNYNVIRDDEGIPYYYHFDALGFYNQIKDKLGPQYRVGGESKTLNAIISELCGEANLEYYCYIDLYTDTSIGDPTLQENDPNWTQPAICNWTGLNTNKFSTTGGKYGGTIRIQTVDKNSFINLNRPFSNIAYNLIGLEVPDLKDEYWTGVDNTGIHPGKRPIDDSDYGLNTSSTVYSDPLDSKGLDFTNEGFTDVGTQSIASGGKFPVATEYWDSGKLNDLKIASSDISIKLNDFTTMKVVTGGKQTRLISAPNELIKHYWGDIILPNPSDPKEVDTITDPLGINQISTRKVPVVTQLLDPEDMDDFIFIDMKEIVGDINIDGVFHRGVYAACMYEIRVAMGSDTSNSFNKWLTFMQYYKYGKLDLMEQYYCPGCLGGRAGRQPFNRAGGPGYASILSGLKLFNNAFTSGPANQKPTNHFPGDEEIECDACANTLIKNLYPAMHEKIKTIGDTHYGKSWYAPVPYFKTKEDLDGKNIVGNFERSWELVDSAYVEPANYYDAKIPQISQFVKEGKVSPFVNYDFNFVFDSGNVNSGTFDEQYIDKLTSPITGKTNQSFNFSEYSLDQLCSTKYGDVSIIHAAPQSIDKEYSFIPHAYETYYDRSLIPYYDFKSGLETYYNANKSAVQNPNSQAARNKNYGFLFKAKPTNMPSTYRYDKDLPRPGLNHLALPIFTSVDFLVDTINGLYGLDYEDNGRFQFAFVKCTTNRVFLPPVKDVDLLGRAALGSFFNAKLKDEGTDITPPPDKFGGSPDKNYDEENKITRDGLSLDLNPFSIAITPKSISYAQISNRHVYGPWITSLNYIPFRGKIEYEQDDSLVPENFLIPTNFGQFGDFTLSQTSGLEGLNLAAQGRANAIDNFALFAVEEGSIKIPGAPAIKRVGDSLYGLPQVTDISINVTNSNVDTSYSFKTISPRFNKNNRDIEKNLSKISNKIKKFKLR